jgi:hypothetical protein
MSDPEDYLPELRELARLEVAASRQLGGPLWKMAPEDRGYSVRCLARAANYRSRAARQTRVKSAVGKPPGR